MNMKLSADHEKIVVTGVAEDSFDDARLLLLSSRDLSLAKDINTSSQNWNSRYVQSLSMDPYKNLAILGFYVGKIILWDLNQLNSWEVKGHSSFVMETGFGAATAYAYSISKQGVMGIYDPTRTINDRFVDTALNNIELSTFVMNPQVHALGDKKNMKLALQSPEGQTLVNLNLPGNLYGLGKSNAELFVELDKDIFILHFDPSRLFNELCQKVSSSLLAAAGESKLKICPAN
jgi:WD40 repeat protein